MIQNELIKLLQASLVTSLENKGQGSFCKRQADNPSAPVLASQGRLAVSPGPTHANLILVGETDSARSSPLQP